MSTQLKFIADLVDGTPHPIYARDLNGILVLCNSSYASFLGEPKVGLLGTGLDDARTRWPFLAPLHGDLVLSCDSRLAQEGDHRLLLPTGGVDVYHWVQPYYDLDGNVQGGWEAGLTSANGYACSMSWRWPARRPRRQTVPRAPSSRP